MSPEALNQLFQSAAHDFFQLARKNFATPPPASTLPSDDVPNVFDLILSELRRTPKNSAASIKGINTVISLFYGVLTPEGQNALKGKLSIPPEEQSITNKKQGAVRLNFCSSLNRELVSLITTKGATPIPFPPEQSTEAIRAFCETINKIIDTTTEGHIKKSSFDEKLFLSMSDNEFLNCLYLMCVEYYKINWDFAQVTVQSESVPFLREMVPGMHIQVGERGVMDTGRTLSALLPLQGGYTLGLFMPKNGEISDLNMKDYIQQPLPYLNTRDKQMRVAVPCFSYTVFNDVQKWLMKQGIQLKGTTQTGVNLNNIILQQMYVQLNTKGFTAAVLTESGASKNLTPSVDYSFNLPFGWVLYNPEKQAVLSGNVFTV